MTNSFADFAKAKMFFVIGSNMTEAHPVAATFLKNAVLNGAHLIVADPRRTKLVDFADVHVPIKVGSDVAFLNGLMHVLITEDLYVHELRGELLHRLRGPQGQGHGVSAGAGRGHCRHQ